MFRKVGWRLLPFLLLGQVFIYVDRVNVAYTKFGMQADIGFSDAAYGFAAGVFFVSYVLFELPSGLLQARIGTRRTLGRILVLWGLASMATCLVRSVESFAAMRLVLGAFEAGFSPCVVIYLSRWFPSDRRAQIVTAVLLAGPLSNAAVGPVSAVILSSLDGAVGLAGWQWLFIIEGLPPVLAGVAAFFVITDDPEAAAWLTPDERSCLRSCLARTDRPANPGLAMALRDRRLYLHAAVLLSLISGISTVNFWLPTMLRHAGVRDLTAVGLLAVIPQAAAFAAMVLTARSSDRTGERRWHVAAPAVLGGLGLVLATIGTPAAVLVGLSLAMVGASAAYAVFWAVPSDIFRGRAAAGGISLINSIGTLGALVSNTLIGGLSMRAGSLTPGLLSIGALLLGGATLALLVVPAWTVTRRAAAGSERSDVPGAELP